MKNVSRDQIVRFCNDYLKVEKFKDSFVNGLQIEGGAEISRIITGVSLNQRLIKSAIEKNAKMIIVHHGLFKASLGMPPAINGVWRNRLDLLLKHNINVLGYHLPLDAHPVIGNNISLINLFGVKNVKPLNTPDYGEIGCIADLKKPVRINEFVAAVHKKLGVKPAVIDAGKSVVKRLGVVSGEACNDFVSAQKEGADTYLTGDIRENIVWEAEEAGINFISAGHYNTEKLGVKNLGELIAKKFKVKVEFVDFPCEI